MRLHVQKLGMDLLKVRSPQIGGSEVRVCRIGVSEVATGAPPKLLKDPSEPVMKRRAR